MESDTSSTSSDIGRQDVVFLPEDAGPCNASGTDSATSGDEDIWSIVQNLASQLLDDMVSLTTKQQVSNSTKSVVPAG